MIHERMAITGNDGKLLWSNYGHEPLNVEGDPDTNAFGNSLSDQMV